MLISSIIHRAGNHGEQKPPIPPVMGAVEYKGVNFRFGEEGSLNLSNINFRVEKGSFIGVVGSSGS